MNLTEEEWKVVKMIRKYKQKEDGQNDREGSVCSIVCMPGVYHHARRLRG